ncbi:MAG: nickel/cobalt transporter (NicO) family protein [Frankiaceae bacterium]|nr:nickel/cobalt transporter (NicO) family protein [Frankiaceae bacterium]
MRRLLLGALAAVALVIATATAASAHPLGNFTVNHYLGVTLKPESVDVRVVTDTAEIPTAQQRGEIDVDGDGALSVTEAAAWAHASCARVERDVSVEVGGAPLRWGITSETFAFVPGAGGLDTGRLECGLRSAAVISSAEVVVRDNASRGRIGWHEITVVGSGVELLRSPVPATSVSDELRHYPGDLLASPLDVREARLHVQAGSGDSTYGTFVSAPKAGPFTRAIGVVDKKFTSLVGQRHATVGSILLTGLLALLLGAGHAALPGHGKTIMAAYLAGKRGSVRDAITVGATVTITHTLGVLLLGLALTVSSALAGDVVTRRLALLSGIIVVGVGVGLLRSALRGGDRGHTHGPGGHSHGPSDHDHPHDHPHPHEHEPAVHHNLGPASGGVALLERTHTSDITVTPRRTRRTGLIGMGVAGGLVPSPSALVVLLSTIALGRAWLGIVLVVLYGLGMAGALTAVGLLLVRASDGMQRRFSEPGPMAQRLARALPVVAAGAVILVGALLTVRAA